MNTIRDYGNVNTDLTLDKYNDTISYIKVSPTVANLKLIFGTRDTTFIIENTSTQYSIGDVKASEISKYEKLNQLWFKTAVIREGLNIQAYIYTNTATYNAGKLTVEIESGTEKDA